MSSAPHLERGRPGHVYPLGWAQLAFYHRGTDTATALPAAAGGPPVDLEEERRRLFERLLGLLVLAALGGEGGTVSDAAEACHALGRACASTGMVFAMHQIMVAILVRHAGDSAWLRRSQSSIDIVPSGRSAMI